jgi:hypothetical protein
MFICAVITTPPEDAVLADQGVISPQRGPACRGDLVLGRV